MCNPLSNVPMGAEYNSNAPWNQEDNHEKEIEVTVSVTLSKSIKIKVNDYEIIDSGKDEDGDYFEKIDYSNCNLKEAVEGQYVLPQNAWQHLISCDFQAGFKSCPEVNMLKDWNVDDFEVVLDN